MGTVLEGRKWGADRGAAMDTRTMWRGAIASAGARREGSVTARAKFLNEF